MPRARQKDGLSAEDLKKQMYQSLQSAGVLNNLKGHLRQSVINELRGRHKGNQPLNESDLLATTMRKNGESSWCQKAIDNLILHHLKQSRYHYSLSLFQQESGNNEYDEPLAKELLLRLGASPDVLLNFDNGKENNQSSPIPHLSSTPNTNHKDENSIVWKILSYVSSAQNLTAKIDQVIPNTTSHAAFRPLSLADKLQAVDDEMDGTLRERRHGDIEYRKSVATLAGATRRAEEAADKRSKESFEQWKKVELATMRVTEMEKARGEVTAKTRQLEDDFSQRKEALLMREKNAIERLNNQRELLEKDLYQQRQLLLSELEQIRVRENNLRQKEQMMRDIETVKLKELELMKSEVFLNNATNSVHVVESEGVGVHSMQRSRKESAVSSCAESLRKSLTGKESRQLDEVLQELDSRSNESEMLRRDLMNLKEELDETKSQLKRLEISTPRHQSTISPRDENDQSLRRRLDALTSQLNDWKQQDRTDREANIQTEIGRWKNEVTKLSDARERLDEKQQQLEDMTLRINARMNAEKSTNVPSSRSRSSTALRVLMDPQSDNKFRSSIRDYDPVHTSHVRWADEMPYSVQPNLMGKSPRSPRFPSHDTSGSSNLDESSTSTSSRDLSTSGLRQDIQEKFRNLEKESDDLEQMYKRYVQSNYKHISPDKPTSRPKTRAPVYNSVSLTGKSRHGTPKARADTQYKKHVDRMSVSQDLGRSQGPLHIKNLDGKSTIEKTTPKSKIFSHQNTEDDLQRGAHQTNPLQNNDDKVKDFFGDVKNEESDSSTRSSANSPFSIEVSTHLRETKEKSMTEMKPTPSKRHVSLPPVSLTQKKLPVLTTPAPTVSELLIGHEKKDHAQKPRPFMISQPGTSLSESQLDNLSLKKLDSEENEKAEGVTSLFERPALLEKKREELERTSTELPPMKSPRQRDYKPESVVRKLESPERDTNLRLDLHNDEGIENILQSIDMSSARSIEDETDPNLVDLLSKLEPINTVASQNIPEEGVTAQEPTPIVSSQIADKFQEDSLSEKSTDKGKSNDEISVENERLLSDRSNDYSDKFLSSTESKTASEVKTMSDFEPSSTSIPRIDDKQSDEEGGKSEADANWSNLQLDKSGPGFEDRSKQESPRVEAQEKDEVDVFEESLSLNSIANDKKSQSSGDDFW